MAERGRDRLPVVAVVGATGLVGEVLLQVLRERRLPMRAIRLMASHQSVGRSLFFRGRQIQVEAAESADFKDIDLVFFAATGDLSKKLAPKAVAQGATVIDKSATWRMQEDVPLVVPEVNAFALRSHQGLIACPNCSTIGLVMALRPLQSIANLRRVVVTTFQAVSGTGREGLRQLTESGAVAASQAEVFPKPIAGNVVPLCETPLENGFTSEEVKLRNETRKILNLPDLDVTMTCVRVPVAVGHSGAVLVQADRALSPAQARDAYEEFPGVEIVDDFSGHGFPTPLEIAGSDVVQVGRIRSDFDERGMWFWFCVDNLRKGAATNAVQIAESLSAQEN